MIPWSDTTVRRLGYGLLALGIVLGVATIAVEISAGRVGRASESIVLTAAFGGVLTLSMRAVPRNGAVWAMAWVLLFGSSSGLGEALAVERAGITLSDLQDKLVTVSPSEIDVLSSLGLAFTEATWVVVLFVLGVHVLILFPGGSAVSPLWRRIAWASGAAIAGAAIPGLLAMAPWVDKPYNEIYGSLGPAGLFGLLWLPLIAASVASLVHLVRRFRRSTGEERLQYRWVTWALGMMVTTILLLMVVGIVFPEEGTGEAPAIIISALFTVALVSIAAGFSIAITKYRLYEIDLVISRTFVYGSLAVFIGAVYVAIVVGIGTLIGSGDEPNAGLAIAATAIVAVAFQPLRRRLEKVANRLVYGRRATPYEVLSEFSRRVAATDESLLDEAARSLVDGTGADHAAVWVSVDDHLVKTAEWPEGTTSGSAETASFPILHDGVELGVLTLAAPRGQRLPEEDRKLATEVASGMGLALRNQVLTESLQARVEELRESRQRLVAVQDETRRKLERDLHDGAQQQLVALKVKLGLARAIAQKSGAAETAAMIEKLAGDADEAVDAMREFARGVYPPLLEAEGLGSAIKAHARRVPIPVSVETDGVGRYPREVEATVYFCVLEALQNTTKHANATQASVSLSQPDGSVAFTVIDDGDGYDESNTSRGAGLTNMEDRLDAAGGTLTVAATPGQGVTITGSIPVLEEVAT